MWEAIRTTLSTDSKALQQSSNGDLQMRVREYDVAKSLAGRPYDGEMLNKSLEVLEFQNYKVRLVRGGGLSVR